MSKDQIRECPECGKNLGSKELLEEHIEMDHSAVEIEVGDKETEIPSPVPDSPASFLYGLILGAVFTGMIFSGYLLYQSHDPGVPVKVTVVTCDNCSYERFSSATDRIFNSKYREVDYQSSEGQKLIDRYNMKYVPGFIFDKKVSEAENFSRVESVLVEFDDAYVLPDTGNQAAQRLSSGKPLPE